MSEQLPTVAAVTGGSLLTVDRTIPLPEGRNITVLLHVVNATLGGDVTLLLDDDELTLLGLPLERGEDDRASYVAGQMFGGGWKAANSNPPRSPVLRDFCEIQPDFTEIRHGQGSKTGTIRIMIPAWMGPDQFPLMRGEDRPAITVLSWRVARFQELIGHPFTWTVPRTGVKLLQTLIRAHKSKDPKRKVIERPADAKDWPRDQPIPVGWSRDVAEGEALPGDVVAGFDANRAYLPHVRQAIVAPGELTHTGAMPFNRTRAGWWQIITPPWPHELLPAPLAGVPEGAEVWVTTSVMRMYCNELDMHVQITDSWTAPAHEIQGLRLWTDTVSGALSWCDLQKYPNASVEAVREALKHLYRSLHSALNPLDDKRFEYAPLRRPDWGRAMEESAWCAIIRRVYRAAGLLTPVNAPRVQYPRYPVELHTDCASYIGSTPIIPPDSFPLDLTGVRPGHFKILDKVKTVEQWTADRSAKAEEVQLADARSEELSEQRLADKLRAAEFFNGQ